MPYRFVPRLTKAANPRHPKAVPKKPPRLITRPCFQQDLQFVQLIYAHAVLTGAGTFEIEPPSLDEMTSRWGHVVERGWPFVVASPPEDVSRVLAFAYAVQYRDRAAYAKTFEVSVYTAHTSVRRGAGSMALAEVLTSLRTDGAREALAFIGDSYNAASIALHEKLGFHHVGTLKNVGEKFGKLLDVVVMQRTLTRQKPPGEATET